MRGYAGERLERSREQPAIGERHARYYLGLAESAEEELLGSGAKAWMSRLEQEHDNIRAALRWTLQQERLDLALPAAVALSRFWRHQDHVGEGRRWVELLLEASREAPGPLRMSVLMAAGALAMYQDDLGVAGEQVPASADHRARSG